MITEIADLPVTPGREDAFAAAYAEGLPFLSAAPGFRAARLVRGVESPSRFVAIVEWESADAHRAYTQSEGFARFGALIGDFFADTPMVEHFTES
ncbi:antibiotic biosynthesis monooxygenase family protein [Actinacidiphila acididurans]|uniref:Antibiotic biosynthesis monooxygenase n=1 Tax=Actinacidiphila acididurans TaxID=2784346 RepID=A0ABS2U476_9ACTN|nr:antibiotic biosynthesis monooxygenase family protein [Actinacidiphila acididurans]MBM9508943.1 antibiotic biosynthesis monooxygenase [Actinacidiphila acididurans]